jgi:hypothetical protein
MLRLLFLVMVLVSSCGKGSNKPTNPDRPPLPIPPQDEHTLDIDGFEEYIFDFEDDAAKHGNVQLTITDLIIFFKDIENENIGTENEKIILGRCYVSPNRTPIVHIDPGHWSGLSDTSRKLLVYHELGHCILERKHEDDVPSIMSAYLLNKFEYEEKEEYFLEELFDSSKFNKFYALILGFEGFE